MSLGFLIMILVLLIHRFRLVQLLRDISINSNGDISLVSLDNYVYIFNTTNRTWKKLENPPGVTFNRTFLSKENKLWGLSDTDFQSNNTYLYLNGYWNNLYSGILIDCSSSPSIFWGINGNNLYYNNIQFSQNLTMSLSTWGILSTSDYEYMEVGDDENIYIITKRKTLLKVLPNATSQQIPQNGLISGDLMISKSLTVIRFDLNTLSIYLLDKRFPFDWIFINCDGIDNIEIDGVPYQNDLRISAFILCLRYLKLYS